MPTAAATATAMLRMPATTAATSAGSSTAGAKPPTALGVESSPVRVTLRPDSSPAMVHTRVESMPTLMPSSAARSEFSAMARTAIPTRV